MKNVIGNLMGITLKSQTTFGNISLKFIIPASASQVTDYGMFHSAWLIFLILKSFQIILDIDWKL